MGINYLEHKVDENFISKGCYKFSVEKNNNPNLSYETMPFLTLTYKTDEDGKLTNENILGTVVLVTKEQGYNMQEYYERIMNSDMARMVKLADRWHNLSESAMASYLFKQKYIKETEKWYLKMAEGTCLEEEIKSELIKLKDSIKINKQ